MQTQSYSQQEEIVRYSLLLAYAYLRHSAYDKTISTMTSICFISILLSSFSLALIAAIRQGFESAIVEKMQGIHAHIIIKSPDAPLDIGALEKVITSEFPAITAYAPSALCPMLIKPTYHDTNPTMILLKGINPVQEQRISSIQQKIIQPLDPSLSLSSLVHDNYIIIGKTLAHDLDLVPTDQVTLFFSDNLQPKNHTITFKTTAAIVSGIFDTGIDEFDAGIVYCSLPFLLKILPDHEPNHLHARIQPHSNEEQLVQQLRNRLQLEVYSWKDLYPALVSALKLEKYGMLFILGLIIIIATMNMISLFYMHITQKRSDIALLKAMGASDTSITSIFFLMGIIITMLASSTGLLLAYGASIFLEKIPFIQLPDVYYVSHLPAHITWNIISAVFIFNSVLCIIALWLPIARTRTITIAQILRFER